MASKSTSELNPRLTVINQEIRNKDRLLNLVKQVEKLESSTDKELPSRINDWLKFTNLSDRSQKNPGSKFTIDVVSDQRYVISFLMYVATKTFSKLEVKESPSFSLFTYLAYMQILFNAYLLNNDIAIRRTPSYHARSFTNNAQKRDYYVTLMNCHVPKPLAELIKQFACVIDPFRNGLEYIPSLAGCKWAHDYGRLVPPQLFLVAHNIISELRVSIPVSEFMRQWYDTRIITVHLRDYLITHFIGGYFTHANALTSHKNWLNQKFEAIFSPAVGRAHLQRPTLARIDITPQVTPFQDPNFYEVMLSWNQEDSSSIQALMGDISNFLRENTTNTIPLHSILKDVGGITTLCHTIEPVVLPTWHFHQHPNAQQVMVPPHKMTSAVFATTSRFMTTGADFQSRIPIPNVDPPEGWVRPLYRVTDDGYNPLTPNYTYKQFDFTRDITPDVLLATPYERNIVRGSFALTLGLKIESEEIDSMAIPVPNPETSLNLSNSHYLIGTLPQQYIQPIIPSTNEANRVRIANRVKYTQNTVPLGFAIRDMGINSYPVFANANVDPQITEYFGITRTDNFNQPNRAWSYIAWRHGELPPITARHFHLWSSYRYTENSDRATRAVHFYYSLRGFNGIGEPLSRIPHPSTTLSIT